MERSIQIPGYTIAEKIGKGGMATVYLATQVSLARTVALKIMAPAMVNDESAKERTSATDAAQRERLLLRQA